MENISIKSSLMIDIPSKTRIQLTRSLLACGVVVGPLYIIVGLIQVITRDGFDIRRHSLSLLSNGDLGWIQITNFLISGLLVLACAAGIRRALGGGRSGIWGSLLVGGYGVGLIGAGIFIADPGLGFPSGTPEGASDTLSWHGLLHLISGSVGFLSLIAACFVFARRFSTHRQRGWAVFSIITGVFFFAAFFGIASGTVHPSINIAFTIAVVLGWVWVSLMASRLMSGFRSS